MKNFDIKFIIKSAIIAAIYVVLTWVLSPISYGAIQFRISEILVLLVVFNPKYSLALILGCLIANTTSSLGWYDMVFGTLATIIAIIPMCFIKKLPIASIFPVISNALIVSFELGLAFDMFQPSAFWFNVLTIAIGEAVVLYLLGIPVMISLSKNENTCHLLEMNYNVVNNKYSFFSPKLLFSIIISVLGTILFVAYPLANQGNEEYTKSAFNLLIKYKEYYALLFLIIPFAISIISLTLKNKLMKIINIILAISLLIPLIIVGIRINDTFNYIYYYLYILYIIIVILLILLIEKSNKKIDNIDDIEI